MSSIDRRRFIKKSSALATGMAAGAVSFRQSQGSPNDRVRVAVIGLRNRGRRHYLEFSDIPNVEITTLCDVDERLFPKAVQEMREKTGKAPRTETDLRRIMDDPDVDVVTIATPDHWHALSAIWACQAGKDVLLEKPVSHNLGEGRLVVEAARKYNRVVCAGTQYRSDAMTREAIDLIHAGCIGDIYMAKALMFIPRDSIGHTPDAPAPPGVHYDLWLGPAPDRPFSENRFHYNWHWFWDYGTTEMGNNGVHYVDIARWGMQKREHPRTVHSTGGYYAFDSDQETPNMQMATLEYPDGTMIQMEVRGVYTNKEAEFTTGTLFYGTEGWMRLNRRGYAAFLGRKNEPGPTAGQTRRDRHFEQFIDCVRSRRWQGMNADILDGHMSTSLCHLANAAYRTGRQLTFDSHAERFVDDDEANGYLTRRYRPPFVVPEEV